MHHFKVSLNGPPEAVRSVVDELRRADAEVLPGTDPPVAFLVWADGHERLADLSARHPEATLGVDGFEAFGGERYGLVVRAGRIVPLERRSIAGWAREWGGMLDEGGEPLEEALLMDAAVSVLDVPVDRHQAFGGTTVDATLRLGSEIGRMCDRATGPYEDDAPDQLALRGVRELAAVALTVASSAPGLSDGELGFERAWRLTQARVHAGLEPLWDVPGRASWVPWLQDLVHGAAEALEATSWGGDGVDRDDDAIAGEHLPTPGERCDTACRRLVSTCLQALALFAEPARGRPR